MKKNMPLFWILVLALVSASCGAMRGGESTWTREDDCKAASMRRGMGPAAVPSGLLFDMNGCDERYW